MEPRSSQCPSIVNLMFGIRLQERDISLQGRLLIAADVCFVVIEIDVLHVLREYLRLGERGS